MLAFAAVLVILAACAGPGRTPGYRTSHGLTFQEVDDFRRQIAGCWILPVGAEDIEGIEDMRVQLHIKVQPDRTVESVTLTNEWFLSRDPASRAVAQSALEAVERCSPLNLPPGKYAVWREIDMNFYPGDALRP